MRHANKLLGAIATAVAAAVFYFAVYLAMVIPYTDGMAPDCMSFAERLLLPIHGFLSLRRTSLMLVLCPSERDRSQVASRGLEIRSF